MQTASEAMADAAAQYDLERTEPIGDDDAAAEQALDDQVAAYAASQATSGHIGGNPDDISLDELEFAMQSAGVPVTLAPAPLPDGSPEIDAATLAEIYSRDVEEDRLEDEWREADNEAKKAKKKWEACAYENREFRAKCRAGRNEPMPLFDAPAEPLSADDEERWRGVGVMNLINHGLSESIANKIVEAGIATIGEVADWTAKKGKRLTDIPGIGETKAEQIETALAAFWAERQKVSVNVVEAIKDAETNGDRNTPSEILIDVLLDAATKPARKPRAKKGGDGG